MCREWCSTENRCGSAGAKGSGSGWYKYNIYASVDCAKCTGPFRLCGEGSLYWASTGSHTTTKPNKCLYKIPALATKRPTPSTTRPTRSPTKLHPCKSGAHTCYNGTGGICFPLTAMGLSPRWGCACDYPYHCAVGCDRANPPNHTCLILPTLAPTIRPTANPTSAPTPRPTTNPTKPTPSPTVAPTSPTVAPTSAPTSSPSSPTAAPTAAPTVVPWPLRVRCAQCDGGFGSTDTWNLTVTTLDACQRLAASKGLPDFSFQATDSWASSSYSATRTCHAYYRGSRNTNEPYSNITAARHACFQDTSCTGVWGCDRKWAPHSYLCLAYVL